MKSAHDKANDLERFSVHEIMQGIPGGFFIYRATGEEELIYANDAMLRLFRCDTMEEFRTLTGNSFKGIVHPEGLEVVSDLLRDMLLHPLQILRMDNALKRVACQHPKLFHRIALE